MSDILQRLTLGMGLSIELAILVKATLLLELALYATPVLQRTRASIRAVVLTATFGVLLVLPLLSVLLPPVSVPMRASIVFAPELTPHQEIPDVAATMAVPNASRPIVRGRSLAVVPLLNLGWAVGVLALLFPLAIACWRLGRLRRRASRWLEGEALAETLAASAGIHKHMDVLRHEGAMVPMTSGFARPMIVMPADIQAWSPADVRRAIVHEVEHVRRADWPLQLMARIVCAVYWFHPRVWVAWRRLRLESERACDDAVLGREEHADYAEQLVRLAERLSIRPEAAILAMTSRSDLSTRVSAVLDDCQVRGRAGALRTGAVAAVAAVLVLAISPLKAVERSATGDAYTVSGQTSLRAANAVPQAFDLVSVKRNTTGDSGLTNDPHARTSAQAGGICSPWGWNLPSETCLRATNITLRELIAGAYAPTGLFAGGVGPLILNGPSWIDSDRFDIVARASGNAPLKPYQGQALAALERTLLADRFKLTAHTESRTLPIYELVRDDRKNGPRLRPATAGCVAKIEALRAGLGSAPPMPPHDPCAPESGPGYLKGGAIDMSQLTLVLANRSNRVVRDETSLPGMFEVNLTWSGDRPSLFTALQEQLGLNLRATTGPVAVLVVDRAEHPTEN